MSEYLAMWKNYVNFKDRTTVRGYWMAVLFNVIAAVLLTVIVMMTGFGILSTIYSLATLVPGIALTVRRLNDAGKSWAYIFVALIPLAGAIWLLVLLCQPSAAGEGVTV